MRKGLKNKQILRAAFAGAAALIPAVTNAQTYTWDSGGTGTNWTTAANWTSASPNDNQVPVAGANLIFSLSNGGSDSSSVINAATFSVANITFTRNGGFSISSSSSSNILTISSGITATAPSDDDYSISAPILLSANNSWNVDIDTTLTLSGVIDDSSTQGFTKGGVGELIISNSGNLFDGAVLISSGTLDINSIGNVGVASAIGRNSTITLSGGALQYTGASASTDRLLTFGTGGGTIESSGSGAVNFSNINALDLSGSGPRSIGLRGSNTGDNRIAGVIGDSGGSTSIVKSGSSKWILDGANTFTGSVLIENGTLQVSAMANGGGASGLGQSTNANTNLVLNGGALRYTGGNATTDRLFSIGTSDGTIDASGTAGTSINFNGSGSIGFNSQNGSRELTLTGDNVSDNTMGVLIRDQGSGSLTSLTKTGSGKWVLNQANTYTGTTTVEQGTLEVISLANGLSASSIGQSSNAAANLNIGGGTLRYVGSGSSTDRLFTLASNGTLDASGAGAVLFTNTGAIAGSSNHTLSLTGSSTSDNRINSNISSVASGTRNLAKLGGGKWVLYGDNTYEGTTSVSAGTLIINGTHGGTGAVTVSSGARLGGSGTLNGNTAVNTGGTLAPGNSQGKFTFSSTLTLQSNSILEMEIGANTTPGTTYDQVEVRDSGANSMVTGGAILRLIGLPGIQTGVPYTIITATNTSTINSAGLLRNGSTLGALMANATSHSQNGVSFTINYSSTAVSLTFSAVPEPSTLGLAMLAGPVLLRRRRRV